VYSFPARRITALFSEEQKPVRIARVCDPEAREQFPNFVHNTTTYVSVPHDAPSQLFVIDDTEPAWASIQVDGREVHAVRLDAGQTVIQLNTLYAPAPASDSFRDNLVSLFSRRRRPNCKSHVRLYAFQVVIQSDTDERKVLATYDFHILCPREYQEACDVHARICAHPEVISPDTISDRAEGRECPNCKRTREVRTTS
jgi:hypothetical protein